MIKFKINEDFPLKLSRQGKVNRDIHSLGEGNGNLKGVLELIKI